MLSPMNGKRWRCGIRTNECEEWKYRRCAGSCKHLVPGIGFSYGSDKYSGNVSASSMSRSCIVEKLY